MLLFGWPLALLSCWLALATCACTVVSASLTVKQPSTAASNGTAFSRHPLSGVYSDVASSSPVPVLLLSFVAHWLLFRFCPLPAPQAWLSAAHSARTATATATAASTAVWRNLVVSTVHAAVAVLCVSCWLLRFDVEWASVQRGLGGGRQGTGDEWQWLAVCWTLGYLLYDSACMAAYPNTRSAGAVFHHAAIGAAFLVGLRTAVGRPFHFLFLLEELSTLPLNAKALLRHRAGLADACAALFAAAFLSTRLLYGTGVFALACMQLAPFIRQAAADGEREQVAAAVFQFVLCTASRLLNLYWATLIARKIRRTLRGSAGAERRSDSPGSIAAQTAGGPDKLD